MMSGVRRGTSRRRVLESAALAVVAVLVANSAAWAGDIKAARMARPLVRPALHSSQRLPAGPPEIGLEAVVSPTTFTVEGLNLLTNYQAGNNTGWLWRTPEPCGAVGPNHLVSVNNGAISWHTKAGVLQYRQLLARGRTGLYTGSFFAALAPLTEGTHPRVMFDNYSQRFVVVVDDWTATAVGDAADSSSLLIAVSDDSDPNGTWHYYKLNSATTVGTAPSFTYDIAVSVGQDAIFIAADYVDFAFTAIVGSRLIIVPKTPLYTGGAGVSSIWDPSTEAGASYQITNLVPVQMYSPEPAGVLTFLVATGWYSTDPASLGEDLFVVLEVDGTPDAPTFPGGWFNSLGSDISNDSFSYLVPQQGTAVTIDAFGPPSAVLRGSNMYIAYTHAPNAGADAGQATVHWIRWNFEVGEIEQGDIGGEDLAVGTSTYYPSIVVNTAGTVAVGFEASGSNLYPGAYYTGRLASDVAGTMGTPQTLAAGVSYYYRVFGASNSANALGPSSSTLVDPVSDTFWTFNGYAISRGSISSSYPTQDGRWGTRWGSFAITGAPPDFNLDGYVNSLDVGRFQSCLTGPTITYLSGLPPACDFIPDAQGRIAADFDRDGDVDLADWGIIQRCYNPDAPAALDCAD